MTRFTALLLAVPTLLVAAHPAAAQRATPAEAKALLAKAVAHYTEAGRAQALADFTAKKARLPTEICMCFASVPTALSQPTAPPRPMSVRRPMR